jgi:hypothetical protein
MLGHIEEICMHMPGETSGIFRKVTAYLGNIQEYAW